MIPARSDDQKAIQPRFRLLGRPRPWRPPVSPGCSSQIERLSIPEGQVLEVDSLKTCPARSTPLHFPNLREAGSILIGWFDHDSGEVSTATGFAGSPSTPEEERLSVAPYREELDLIRRLAVVLQPPLATLLSPDAGLDWPAPLMPFQRDGVAVLVEEREVLLADDMGLGKTIQAAAAMRVLFHRRQIAGALIVAPASLLRQWRAELAAWAPELRVTTVTGDPATRATLWRLPAHIRLVGYETLRSDVLDLRHSPVLRDQWDLVILDEASRIKNRETGVSIACKRIPRDRRWALTGTPLENDVDDVVSILDFLLAGSGERVPRNPGPALQALLSRVQLRRRKADVLPDLPAKRVIDVPLDLPPAQRYAYDRAEKEGVIRLSERGASVSITNVLELIIRLKQICNSDPASGESAKLADMAERMAILTAEGHRALIFSQFTDHRYGVAAIARRMEAYHPLTLTGDMSGAARATAVDAFMRSHQHRVLILSLKAGGVGLNLQAASYVFHMDRWWNPAIEDQAESRAHRFGQVYPVTVYRYTCVGTIEERIARKLDEKRQLFREVVDDVSMDLQASLTRDELFGLFNMSAPPAGKRQQEPETP